jgi:hypothetical protein
LMHKRELRRAKVFKIIDRDCKNRFHADGIEDAFDGLMLSKKLVGSFEAKSLDRWKVVAS